MAKRQCPYRYDEPVPPGWLLDYYLTDAELDSADFARRNALAPDLVDGVLDGSAPLDGDLASALEREFDLEADFWLGLEAKYRRCLAQKQRVAEMSGFAAWGKAFPVALLEKRGVIDKPASDADAVVKLLDFFGVSSVEEWHSQNGRARVAYRSSPTFDSDEFHLAAWLRLGEIEAQWQDCADYDEGQFREALCDIRVLTRGPTRDALTKASALCNQSGVALALVEPLPKVAVSGATRWLSGRQALIQLSVRHRTNDHMWFTLFHEAAHVLLHGRDSVYIDTAQDEIAEVDAEADRWASNFLIADNDWERFVGNAHFGEWSVRRFAGEQGIAPAIVVGRLQHERRIPWSSLNYLKARARWEA